MVVRDERAAGAVPGPPSIEAWAGAVRHALGRLRYLLTCRSSVISVAVLCVTLLLVNSLPPVSSWHGDEQSGLQAFTSPLNATTPTDYPYVIEPWWYPEPSNLSNGHAFELPRLVALGSGFALLNLSYSSGQTTLWFTIGSYSASIAVAIYAKQACLSGSKSGGNCVVTPTVPIQWSAPTAIATISGTVGADALVTLGTEAVVAATEGTSTTLLYFDANPQTQTWSSAVGIPGTGGFPSLALDPEYLFAADFSGSTIWGTTYALGADRAVANYTLTAPNPVQNLSVALVPASIGYTTTVVVSTTSTDRILYNQLAQGGSSFSPSWKTVASYAPTTSSSVFTSIGGTYLTSPGGIAGQIATVAAGNALLVLYTTTTGGRIAAETTESSDGGANWTGPFLSSPPVGSVQDPSLTEGADQLTYATWRVDNGTWGIDQAVYLPDGAPASDPAELPGSGVGSSAAIGAPSIAVDPFERPLFVWPAVGVSGSYQLDYAGGYPNATIAVDLLNDSLYDPITFYDGGSGGSGGGSGTGSGGDITDTVERGIAALEANVTSGATEVAANTSSGKRCAALNLTVDTLYAWVTHVVLGSGGSSDCSATTTASKSPLVNETGSFVPNIYLANYADIALESEGYVVGTPPLSVLAPAATSGSGLTAPQTSTGNAVQSGKTWTTLNVTSVPWSPTAIELEPGVFASFGSTTQQKDTPNNCCEVTPPPGDLCSPSDEPTETTVISDSPDQYSLTVTILSGNDPSRTFSSTTATPTVFLSNLSAYSTVEWRGTYQANYSATEQVTRGPSDCSGTVTTHPTPASLGLPSQLTVANLTGNGTTQLGILPGSPFVYAPFTSHTQASATLSLNWNNSMQATVSGSLVYTSNLTTAASVSNSTYQIKESFSLGSQRVNSNFTLSLAAQSRTGGWTAGQAPAVSDGESLAYPDQVAPASCSFELTAPWFNVSFGHVFDITDSSAVIQWNASASGEGELRYFSYDAGVNETILGIPGVYNASNSPSTAYVYTVQLHDLLPWAQYNVSYGLYADRGCLGESLMQYAPGGFATPPALGLTETDLPYDSITGEGGGAQFSWNVPSYFLGLHPTLVSGGLAYSYSGGAAVAPLNQSEFYSPGGLSPENQAINLTLPEVNVSYSATLWLNYSYKNPAGSGTTSVAAESPTISFVYQLDSSGDGLTNLEKSNGWVVALPSTQTFEGIPLSTSTSLVTADPYAWATNGLVNDYVEKEYDLNAHTLDTADSGMLDTWNLTFSLGSSDSCPADFSCFTDTAANPFNESQYPGESPTGGPVHTNTSAPRYLLDDSVPYDATVLWEGNTLAYLQELIQTETWGESFRGFIGSYDGSYTLTVWGKLSWGADPLVSSSIHDGIADGTRVDPASAVDIEISDLNATCSGLSSGTGWAVKFTPRNGSATSGGAEFSNYSQPAISCGSSSSEKVANYNVALPISQLYATQTIQISVIANESKKLTPLAFNGTANEKNLTFNLFGKAASYSFTGSGSTHATLSFTIATVAIGGKAPTYLWLPDGNGTVNGLPNGLERYTGEQSFDLVVVNASSSISITGVPDFWSSSSTYGIALDPGLNNFLIPREEFLNTSFGRGVLENSTEPYTNTTASPPLIISGGDENLISSFGASTLLGKLSCYWQNRAVSSGTKTITGCEESGTAAKTEGAISTLAVDSLTPPANNTGGVPGSPYLETPGEAGAAVQAIVTVNVTSTNELQLLLAGLLDNVTGGVNGTFESITGEVPFMGLLAPVLGALGNATVVTDGLYGAPTGTTPSSTTAGAPILGWFWNSPIGVVYDNALHFLVSVVELSWTLEFGAWVYLAHLTREGLALDGFVLSRAATVLAVAGRALVNMTVALLNVVGSAILTVLSPVLAPLVKLDVTYAENLANVTVAAEETFSGGTISESAGRSFWAAFGGSVFYMALSLGIAVDVVVAIVTGLSLGGGFLVGAALSVAFTAAIEADRSQESSTSSKLGGHQTLNGGLAFYVENFTNTTGHKPQGANQSFWNTIGSAFLWAATLFSFQISTGLLAYAFILDEDVAWQTAAFVLGAVSIMLSLAALVLKNTAYEYASVVRDTAVAIAGAGVALDIRSVIKDFTSPTKNSYIEDLDLTVLGLDSAAFAVSLFVA